MFSKTNLPHEPLPLPDRPKYAAKGGRQGERVVQRTPEKLYSPV